MASNYRHDSYVLRDRIIARLKGQQSLRLECSWCGVEIAPGPEPTSHGICASCSRKWLEDARTPLENE